MRKFISILLSCMLVVAMCCIGISASAVDNDKAIIHVYNFYGDTIDDAKADTHPELAEKSVEGETYTFDVGDVVNIYINYSSDVEDAAATALGDLYINQVSTDPTDAEAFSKNTDGSLNTLKFTDKYFTSDERDAPAESGIYYSGIGNGSMCNPDMVFDKDDSNWTESQDSSIDRCKYLVVYPYSGGYSVATPKRVFTMTVVVTEASESYLYTALESVTKPDVYDDADAAEIGDDIIVSTTMKKVDHIDIEQPTEPETEVSTETPTEAPTEMQTETLTEAPTEASTEAPTEVPTEAATENPTLPPIYTVIGSSALCGSNMDPADTNNDMAEVGDGLFQKVYTNVAAGDIEFKVVENHSWDIAFGLDGANCVDTVIYDDATVVINFDSTTGVVTWTIDYPEVISTEAPTEVPTEAPTAEITEVITEIPTEAPTAEITEIITEIPTEAPTEAPTETPTVTHTYTIAGSAALCVSNWDPADLNNDMTEISNGIFQKVYTGVNVGGIEFKVAEDHSWDNSFGPEGNALGSANCVADVLYDNAIVTINFDSTTGFVTWKVDYPEVPTDEPTEAPTEAPTDEPTEAPTEAPTDKPTEIPTEAPTDEPTEAPTDLSTDEPTEIPTDVPTDEPTEAPTNVAKDKPTTPTGGAISPTSATNATSSTVTTTTQTSQTPTGKVATGDASSVAMLLGILMIAAGAVVSVRRKVTSK